MYPKASFLWKDYQVFFKQLKKVGTFAACAKRKKKVAIILLLRNMKRQASLLGFVLPLVGKVRNIYSKVLSATGTI